jgi:hypothetical protein
MEPKYKIGDIGDEVWVMEHNKPCKKHIVAIVFTGEKVLYGLHFSPDSPRWIHYFVPTLKKLWNGNLSPSWSESMELWQEASLFPSKEALIQSL